jgi:hypothetical protein
MILAIDFDGTLVDHRFPRVGDEVPEAFRWLKRFQELGARLVLYTMRSDEREDGGNYLNEAVEFCRSRGVEFWAHNMNPQQASWTASPKVYAHWYIDDAAFGCPLRPGPHPDSRPVVDWSVVGPEIERLLLLEKS